VSLGIIRALIPIRNPIGSLAVQLALIVGVGLLAVTINGNDFPKPKNVEGLVEGKPQASRVAALAQSIIAFIGCFLLFFMIVLFGMILILDKCGIPNIPSIPNIAMRWVAWFTMVFVPPIFAFFLARCWYQRFNLT
jgi:hypothetical protein